MGDSITEGSIASVLKGVGESVAEDEVIVQIETDKVTIDVRAPKAGVVNAVLVQEDETVVVGQHIATIEEGAEGTVSTSSSSSSSTSSSESEVGAEQAHEEVSSVMEAVEEARLPSIQFPPRRTQDGRVISQLSLEDRIQLGLSVGESVKPTLSASFAATPMFSAFGVDATWNNYTPNYDDHITRRVISEKEIESINLGGA